MISLFYAVQRVKESAGPKNVCNEKGIMTLEGKHNFSFVFFLGRAEVLLHLSLHWWRRGVIWKLLSLESLSLKNEALKRREWEREKTAMFYKPFHLPDEQPRIGCNVQEEAPCPFFSRDLLGGRLLPRARPSRSQLRSALGAALGSLLMLEFNRLCPCAHSAD